MSVVTGRSACRLGGLSDDELVRLARGGHEPAFDAVVHRYRAPLVSYCRRWLDPHRAEEVVQHTFMKAYLCVRDDDRPLVLRPWLYRVAHNAALNTLEKKGSDWEELDENYDGVPQPPQVAEQRARFLAVVDGIDALPVRQRDALLLNEFEGRCYADIAARLGTSESGVRGLLRRARRQLRETAAALLLPFPALRELVRSDASRFQMDRAGEVIGSAGAVGGAGVAGGLTKVAAGMLAAGTIATGGTAIEHRQQRDSWKSPTPPSAQDGAAESSESAAATRTRSLVAEGTEEIGGAVPIVALAGGGLIADAPESARGGGESLVGIDETVAPVDDPGTVQPSPLAPTEPKLPLADEPEPESNEDADDADEGEATTQPKEPGSTTTTSGGGQTQGSTQPTSEPRANGEPAALPAGPLQPLR